MRIATSFLIFLFCHSVGISCFYSIPAHATATQNPQKILAQTLLLHQQETQYTQAKAAYTANPTPQQLEAIAKQVYALAQAGYAPAQYTMGQFLRKGIGGVQQPTYARFWYQAAAMQQHPLAMWHLALCYQQGVGGSVDSLKALEWFEATAKASSPYTQKALWNASALHYELKTGRLQSMEKPWVTLATMGDSEAKNNIGVLYLSIPTKARLGVQYLQQASSMGNVVAKAHLGSWLYQQPKVKPETVTQAVLLMTQSANAGVGLGEYNLGQYYYQKRFAPAYAKLAFSWLMVAKTQHPALVSKTMPLLNALNGVLPASERQSLLKAVQAKHFPNEGFPLQIVQQQEILPTRFSTLEGFQFKVFQQWHEAEFN
jgi:TPR repeat protein